MNRRRHQSGNAFLITLVSVILLGALTFVTMRQMGSSATATLSDEKAEIYANQLIGQANAMRGVIDQMLTTGTTIDTLNFDKPSDVSFNSGTTINKVFHPAGGGLNVSARVPETIASDYVGLGVPEVVGWQVQYGYNTEWTPTTATDVLYSYIGLKKEVCAKINKILTGSDTIPLEIIGVSDFNQFFSRGGATDGDFPSSACGSCVGKPMFCVGKPNGTDYVFYSIVAAR